MHPESGVQQSARISSFGKGVKKKATFEPLSSESTTANWLASVRRPPRLFFPLPRPRWPEAGEPLEHGLLGPWSADEIGIEAQL